MPGDEVSRCQMAGDGHLEVYDGHAGVGLGDVDHARVELLPLQVGVR